VGFEPAQWVVPEAKQNGEPDTVMQPAETVS
jgi:hypothetical protein